MLLAMFLGMGFYAAYIVDQNGMSVIAKQVHQLMVHGLLDRCQNASPLPITPPVAAAVSGDGFTHTWPGLAG
jgi:hypothetical protein